MVARAEDDAVDMGEWAGGFFEDDASGKRCRGVFCLWIYCCMCGGLMLEAGDFANPRCVAGELICWEIKGATARDLVDPGGVWTKLAGDICG